MAKKAQRAFAFSLAMLFLITTVGFTGVILWQVSQEGKQANTEEALMDELNQQSSQGKKLEGFTPIAKVDKLTIIDTKEGSGAEAKTKSTVTVHYTGALAKDGTIFQSSKDFGEPVSFGLSEVIKGWGEGIPGMKVGGVRRLVIPAKLAYGEQSPSADIPPNSDLVFDVELIEVQ